MEENRLDEQSSVKDIQSKRTSAKVGSACCSLCCDTLLRAVMSTVLSDCVS